VATVYKLSSGVYKYGEAEIPFNVYVADLKPNTKFTIMGYAEWASARGILLVDFRCVIAPLVVAGETGVPILVAYTYTDYSAILKWFGELLAPLARAALMSGRVKHETITTLLEILSYMGDVLAEEKRVEEQGGEKKEEEGGEEEKKAMTGEEMWKRMIAELAVDFLRTLSDVDEAWRLCPDKIVLWSGGIKRDILQKIPNLPLGGRYFRACGTVTYGFSGVHGLWSLATIYCDATNCYLDEERKIPVGQALYIVAPSVPFEWEGKKYVLRSSVQIREGGWELPWWMTIPDDLKAFALGAGLAAVLSYAEGMEPRRILVYSLLGGVIGYGIYKAFTTDWRKAIWSWIFGGS